MYIQHCAKSAYRCARLASCLCQEVKWLFHHWKLMILGCTVIVQCFIFYRNFDWEDQEVSSGSGCVLWICQKVLSILCLTWYLIFIKPPVAVALPVFYHWSCGLDNFYSAIADKGSWTRVTCSWCSNFFQAAIILAARTLPQTLS